MFISVRKDPNMSMPATKMPFSINLGFMAFTISRSLSFNSLTSAFPPAARFPRKSSP